MRSNICKAAVSMGRGNRYEKQELHSMKHVGSPGVLSLGKQPEVQIWTHLLQLLFTMLL